MIMSTRTALASLRVLFKIMTRRYYGFADLKHVQARTIRVTSDPPMPVQIDGEPMGETPFLAEVIPHAVQFLVPIDYE
jgi:diacylglycerol kinase family enzyme